MKLHEYGWNAIKHTLKSFPLTVNFFHYSTATNIMCANCTWWYHQVNEVPDSV